jgi:hypothetical protein
MNNMATRNVHMVNLGGPPLQVCPVCKCTYTPELCEQASDAEWVAYNSGVLAQNAFKQSTAIQREQLISGICSDACWDALMGDGEV